MAKKAILFVRVSTERQHFDEQEAQLFEMAVKDGYKEKNIIPIAEKESGRKLSEEERKGLKKMKALIESDKDIDCVYCWEVSRIARTKKVNFSILDYLENKKIQLKVMNPYIVLFNPNGTINDAAETIFTLYTQMAESEMRVKFERFARGKKENTEKGRYNGGMVRYGYKVDNEGYYVIDEEKANVVRLIFNMYANENVSVLNISDYLKERGIEIQPQRINQILSEEAYIGKKGNRPYPIIINEELFKKAKEVAKGKNTCVNKSKKYYFGSRLMVCPCCGKAMTPYKSMGYACSQHYSVLKACNNTCTVSINAVETILLMQAQQKYISMAIKEAKGTTKRLIAENKDLEIRLNATENEIEKRSGEFDKIGMLYRKGIIRTEEELDKAINEVNDGLKELNDKKAELENRIKSNNELIEELKNGGNVDVQKIIQDVYSATDAMSYKEAYDMIHKVIEKVIVTNEEDDGEPIKVFNITYKDGKEERICFYSMRAKGKTKIFGLWDEDEKVWIEEDYTDSWIKRV